MLALIRAPRREDVRSIASQKSLPRHVAVFILLTDEEDAIFSRNLSLRYVCIRLVSRSSAPVSIHSEDGRDGKEKQPDKFEKCPLICHSFSTKRPDENPSYLA
jgi:hypothetical protein